MILSVANPIYDSVFKFLMEDKRIAKTVLSALLKKNVVSVEMRRHEHTNTTRDNLSMFRIDFAARVEESDGSTKLILIELQKTWLETETLRFRQYLAAQYNAQENMQKTDSGKSYGVPMIAVYLLGHRVGDINKPVVYVNHDTYDYDGKTVASGKKDPFINSLVHDSIIVQLPLLPSKISNRLDKVLSVFNQKQRDPKNRQMININEDAYENDDEMMYIVHRLTIAAANAELRQEMNVEDEYFSAIEDRDTAIMNRDKIIAEKNSQIAEQNSQIAEQSSQIAEQNSQIAEQNSQIAEQSSQIATKDNQLRSVIKMMLQNGMRIEDIAVAMSITVEDINALLSIDK